MSLWEQDLSSRALYCQIFQISCLLGLSSNRWSIGQKKVTWVGDPASISPTSVTLKDSPLIKPTTNETFSETRCIALTEPKKDWVQILRVAQWHVLGFVYLFSCFTLNEIFSWLNVHLVLLLFSHSVVSDSFVTPWPVAHQVPLSRGFPKQECWSGLLFPSPEDLLDPGIGLMLPVCSELQVNFSPPEPWGKSPPAISRNKSLKSFKTHEIWMSSEIPLRSIDKEHLLT